MTNPLLKLDALPLFADVLPGHVEPAITAVITKNKKLLANLLTQKQFTFDNLIYPLEIADAELNYMWSVVEQLHAVNNTAEWREAYQATQPHLVRYATEVGQNTELFHAFEQIKTHEYGKLNQAQKVVVDNGLRDFQLSGVALPTGQKQFFAELQEKLAEAMTQFEENVLDATEAWSWHTDDVNLLKGLPEDVIETAAATARTKNQSGYVLTLEEPCYFAVMKFADHQPLRQAVYQAYVTRASDQGPHAKQFDNTNLIYRILQLRYQAAHCLQFDNYVQLSLATKMASSPEEVLDFLDQLRTMSRPYAEREWQALKKFAQDQYQISQINNWDVTYLSEKLQKQLYDVDEEQIRAYFPVQKVLSGLFAITEKLFKVKICQRDHVSVWHPTVMFFELLDAHGGLQGQFYLDLYARPGKREGAWMAQARSRVILPNGELQIPLTFLNCNFNLPVNQEAYLTHDEVLTMFHEFGHGLQHLLTTINYPSVSGTDGVPWDVVEVASQILENWAWQKPGLAMISAHRDTGQPLPEALLQKLIDSKNFHVGLHLVRQLEFALFDFKLHLLYHPDNPLDLQKFLQTIREHLAVIAIPEYARFTHTFGHIFAGEYAAGYYSYLWAEVISADMFSQFLKSGIFDPAIAERFLTTFLALGGVADPKTSIKNFLGRDLQLNAFFQQNGLH